MKLDCDAETDVLTMKLRPGKPDFGEQEGNVITHYSKDYKPVEIEILDASSTTEKMVHAILSQKKSTAPQAREQNIERN